MELDQLSTLAIDVLYVPRSVKRLDPSVVETEPKTVPADTDMRFVMSPLTLAEYWPKSLLKRFFKL